MFDEVKLVKAQMDCMYVQLLLKGKVFNPLKVMLIKEKKGNLTKS